jgi:hypothetical protein
VERLTGEGRAGQFGLPRVATELYQSARRLRVFTARPLTRDIGRVRELIQMSPSDVEDWLGRGGSAL